jgi:hypothetical protein
MVGKGSQTLTGALTTASLQSSQASTEGQLNTKRVGEASVSSPPSLTRPSTSSVHELSE